MMFVSFLMHERPTQRPLTQVQRMLNSNPFSTQLGDSLALHECVVAYISDHMLLATCLGPHPDYIPSMMASLDHSMWFHAPFRADEWMLYDITSPQMSGHRGLCWGRLFRADGTLAVSVVSGGVVRKCVWCG